MRLNLRNLSFEAIIGVLPNERERLQRVVANAEIDYAYSRGRFLDYALVARLIEMEITNGGFALIEDALGAVAAKILSLSGDIKRVKLSIEKPEALPNAAASLSLEINGGTLQ
ncbi:MAG: dihydroneopterin aldolase [Helicobacteraceae bacterium]|jgi:dihydroneopterin aldolase|nr:dihydroneopterin aldolase [Helicobacteraceae bacterium]